MASAKTFIILSRGPGWILKRVPVVTISNKVENNHLGMAWPIHYSDVTMGTMASKITSLTIVYSTVYSGADQRKHHSSASLAFVRGIHRSPMNSPHKWPVTQKMFPFDDVSLLIAKHPKYRIQGLDYWVKLMLNSMLINKDFLTWLLIGWQLGCRPIRCQVWKSLLTNMDFNMEISYQCRPLHNFLYIWWNIAVLI